LISDAARDTTFDGAPDPQPQSTSAVHHHSSRALIPDSIDFGAVAARKQCAQGDLAINEATRDVKHRSAGSDCDPAHRSDGGGLSLYVTKRISSAGSRA
jgi:hypothetical protein